MAKITKEQLKGIIKKAISASKEDSFLKVLYDDEWKKNKKLYEKIIKLGIETEDIVCVIGELTDVVIFKQDGMWISFTKKSYRYSDLLIAYPKFDIKHNKNDNNNLYFRYIEKEEQRAYIQLFFNSLILVSIVNEIVKVEKELLNEETIVEYYFDLCKKGWGINVCVYCEKEIRKYAVDNNDVQKLTGYVEWVKVSDVLQKANKKAYNKTMRNFIPIMFMRMTFQGKKVEKKSGKYIEEMYVKELNNAYTHLEKSMENNCIEGYYLYFVYASTLLYALLTSNNVASDREIVEKTKIIAEELYAKIDNKTEIYSGKSLFGGKTGEVSEREWFMLFYVIGDIYYNYIVDKSKAMDWFSKALLLDVAQEMERYPDIMYKIALCYKTGDGGLIRSDEEMEHCLKEGALHDHGACELELAEFCQRKSDPIAAAEWKKRAHAHGLESEEDKAKRHQKLIENATMVASLAGSVVTTVASVKKAKN